MTDFMLKFSLSISLCSGFLLILASILQSVSESFALLVASGLFLTAVSWLVFSLTLIWS